MGAEKNKKCNEKISVLVCRSGVEASGNAHHCSGFCSKKVRISTKRYRKFWVRAFPRKNASARSADDWAEFPPNPNPAKIFHAPRGSKSMVRL